jgi:hypothetical protein
MLLPQQLAQEERSKGNIYYDALQQNNTHHLHLQQKCNFF